MQEVREDAADGCFLIVPAPDEEDFLPPPEAEEHEREAMSDPDIPPGAWPCERCNHVNPEDNYRCQECGCPNPERVW